MNLTAAARQHLAPKIRAILVNDKEHLNSGLRASIEGHGVDVIAELPDGFEAIKVAESLRPELFFVSCNLAEGDLLDAIRSFQHSKGSVVVILVLNEKGNPIDPVRFSEFETSLFPITPERLNQIIGRRIGNLKLSASVSQFTAPSFSESRLPIRTPYAIKFLKFNEIVCAVAREKKVYVRTSVEEHKSTYSLVELETLLPSEQFLRIHASAIVRVDLVDQLNFLGNHTYSVTMGKGNSLPVGRSYYRTLKQRLGFEHLFAADEAAMDDCS